MPVCVRHVGEREREKERAERESPLLAAALALLQSVRVNKIFQEMMRRARWRVTIEGLYYAHGLLCASYPIAMLSFVFVVVVFCRYWPCATIPAHLSLTSVLQSGELMWSRTIIEVASLLNIIVLAYQHTK